MAETSECSSLPMKPPATQKDARPTPLCEERRRRAMRETVSNPTERKREKCLLHLFLPPSLPPFFSEKSKNSLFSPVSFSIPSLSPVSIHREKRTNRKSGDASPALTGRAEIETGWIDCSRTTRSLGNGDKIGTERRDERLLDRSFKLPIR